MKRIVVLLLSAVLLLFAMVSCQTKTETLPQTLSEEVPPTSTYDDRYQFLPPATKAPQPQPEPDPYELAVKLLKNNKGLEITDEHVEAIKLCAEKNKNVIIKFLEGIQERIEEKTKMNPDFRYEISSNELLNYVTYDYGAFYLGKELVSFNDYGLIKTYAVLPGTEAIRGFSGNELIERVVIPKGVTSIKENTFADCPSLTTLDLQNEPIGNKHPLYGYFIEEYSIGEYKKANSTYFNHLVDYNNLFGYEIIDSYSGSDYPDKYEDMSELYEKTYGNVKVVDDDPDNYVIVNGVLMAYRGIGGHIVIPEGVTQINGNVFGHCASNVLSLKLPSTLKVLGTWNIVNMTSILDLTVPDGLERIESEAIITNLPGKGGVAGDYDERGFIKINNIPEDCEVADDAFFFETKWAYDYFYKK